MNSYPALKTISTLSKLMAVLIGVAVAALGSLAGLAYENVVVIAMALIAGLLLGVTLYAAGELITLIVHMADDMRVSANSTSKLYIKSQQKKVKRES